MVNLVYKRYGKVEKSFPFAFNRWHSFKNKSAEDPWSEHRGQQCITKPLLPSNREMLNVHNNTAAPSSRQNTKYKEHNTHV
jgi:hypothetical protein